MDRSVALTFLSALFPEVPANSSILLWTLKQRRSYWSHDHESAIACAERINGDVYVGACLGPRGLGEGERATADEVIWMPGLWADVDFRGPAHQKTNLPANADAARKLVESMPLLPTLLVHSGHGIQAWWLYKELLEFTSAEARKAAVRISHGWHKVLLRHAEAQGWTVDATWDLARIMRLAGTKNFKHTPVADVTILDLANERRYSPDDFESYFVVEPDIAPAPVQRTLAIQECPEFVLRPDANQPVQKHDVAMENEPVYAETWRRQRKDLRDASMSGYDQSLADQLCSFGWTDQEIVDTLIAFRRKHGQSPKLRVDYYRGTLLKARRTTAQRLAEEKFDELALLSEVGSMPELGGEDGGNGTTAKAEPAKADGDDEKPRSKRISKQTREECLRTLSQWLGFRVEAVIKTRSEEPLYMLRTELGSIKIGRIDKITSKRAFINRVAAATDYIPKEPEGGKKKWEKVAQTILSAVEVLDIGPDATDEGAARGWVCGYIEDYPPVDLDKVGADEMQEGYPFFRTMAHGGRVLCFNGRHFKHWLRSAPGYGEKLSGEGLGVPLACLSASYTTVRVGKSSLKVWTVPVEALHEPERAPKPVKKDGEVVELKKESDSNTGDVTPVTVAAVTQASGGVN